MSSPPQANDLSRFIEAQANAYEQALSELRAGRKQSHWMWFIFPQLSGLGFSSTSRYYALRNLDEARAYLDNPLLGARLIACTESVLSLSGLSAKDVFGGVDSLKFRSSMTLFSKVAGPHSPFGQALDKYFEGEPDGRTLELLQCIGE